MSTEKKRLRRKLIFFIAMIVYVFAFLFWWSYLLYSKTIEHFDQQVNVELMANQTDLASFEQTEAYEILLDDFTREKRMIVTEGLVFFLILIFGMIRLGISFSKELEIARQQRNFILSITHELKSPLSSIKLMSETMVKRELDRPTQDRLLGNSIEEVERLENLVENILLAAKIENNQFGFTQEPQNLSSIVGQCITQFESSKKVVFKNAIQESLYIIGDKSALTSIVVNLVENALKYAPQSPYLEIDLYREADKAVLDVKDLGNGIPDEEKEKVFSKFYRIGNEDTRQAKGTGLGLYIVKQIVEFHQGQISLNDNHPNGCHFRVEFPV